MKTYDILLVSLHRTLNKHNLQWVRGIQAQSLTEASRIAVAMHPKLGVTPTEVSMGWHV